MEVHGILFVDPCFYESFEGRIVVALLDPFFAAIDLCAMGGHSEYSTGLRRDLVVAGFVPAVGKNKIQYKMSLRD
jgi:hypothetical protein